VPSNPPKGKGGCLFNIFDDPTEHNDIAATNPEIVQELYARILEIQKTAFSPDRGSDDGTSCKAALEKWGGFFGPFLP
jgi:arylsulfatase B